MAEARSRRVFFALWPDEEAASHLAALGNHLAGRGGRVMQSASLHMTLAFIGAVTVERMALLEELAEGIRAEVFELSLDRLGFWPQRGILWAGCRQSPAPLRRLFDAIGGELRAAGVAVESRLPVPHITLARGARCLSLPRMGAPIRWHVDGFALVESHLQPSGASYRTLRRFALDEADAG